MNRNQMIRNQMIQPSTIDRGEPMKTMSRLLLIACLVLPFAACKQQDSQTEAVVTAPLTAPTNADDTAWGAYLTDVVKRNMEGVNANPYLYYLPAEATADFQGYYDRQLEKTQLDLARGITEGNFVAFGSPASAKMADLIVASFAKVDPASMKGVKVLFIGNADDNARVKAAVEPAGVSYAFVEAR
jgi:hypothetical protein